MEARSGIGWEPDRVSLCSRTSNLRSVSNHPEVVDFPPNYPLGAWLTHSPTLRRIALGQPLRHNPKEPPACQVPACTGYDLPVSMTAL